jgi:hypothetical protein
MNTQFFQQLAGLGFTGNFLLNIHQDEAGNTRKAEPYLVNLFFFCQPKSGLQTSVRFSFE